LEREKKARADLDKSKRKLEGDLKSAQGSLEELERIRKDLEDGFKKKDAELKAVSSKVEEEQSQSANLNKKLKELQVIFISLRLIID
jgi:hypothetical protein